MTTLASLGYTNLTELAGQACGLRQFMFTTGLMVGLDEIGYERRYCYERREDALQALLQWDGHHHPPGPWIKCKGRMHGVAVDMLNPELEAA